MNLKPIKTEEDYKAALSRLDQIFDADEDTAEGDEAEILAILIERYEDQHYPIEVPDPVEAIKIRMEEMGLRQVDLVETIGSKSRVSEIINRKRPLTVVMIRKLESFLNIPATVLVQQSSV